MYGLQQPRRGCTADAGRKLRAMRVGGRARRRATFGASEDAARASGAHHRRPAWPRWGDVMDKDLVDHVIDTAQRVVASGAISANGHGNVSLRVPGAAEMYFTAGPSLRNHPAAAVVRVGLDGTLLEGELPPIQGAVVAMHTAMYADHPEVGCVVHTHSPYATAYAVARRPIGCWVEALAMFGLPDGVPVARYGPRGSSRPSRASGPRSCPGAGGAPGQPRCAGLPPVPGPGDHGRRGGRGSRSGWY